MKFLLSIIVFAGFACTHVTDTTIHTSYDALVSSSSAVNAIEHAHTEEIIAHAQAAGETKAQVTAEVVTWRGTVGKVDAVIDAGFAALEIAIQIHDDKSISSLTTAAIQAVKAVAALRSSISSGTGAGSGSGG